MRFRKTALLLSLFATISFCSSCNKQDNPVLLINEVCASSKKCFIDKYGSNSDWIELYNNSDKTISLDGYKIVKKSEFYNPFIFNDITIESHSYLLLVCSGRSEYDEDEIHLPFTLSQADGEYIYLYNKSNDLINSVRFQLMKDDISYGLLNNSYQTLIPSPGEINVVKYTEKEILKAPTFSHRSGRYNSDFKLSLSSPIGTKIVYSLDCSDPTFDSMVYKSPILVKDPTLNENVVSSRTDISATRIPYVPTSPVNKCFVVKAMTIDDNGNYSKIISNSYWIRQDYFLKNDINLVSITSDIDNLFGYENGIYCNGKVFDDYKNSPDYNPSDAYYHMPANYTQKGIDWERPSNICYVDENNKCVCNQRVGLRVHGNSSRCFPKKGFNIFCRPTYDGNSHFTYNFNDKISSAISLRSGGNNDSYILNDYYHNNIASYYNLNFETEDQEAIYLYLNGEFWGLYFISDKYSEDYFIQKYNILHPTIIKNGFVESKYLDKISVFNDYLSYRSKDFTKQTVVDSFLDLVNIDSLIDYFLFEYYISNIDWTFWNNNGFYLNSDNKIQFTLFDVDFDGGISRKAEDTIFSGDEKYTFLYLLMICKNDALKEKVFNRTREMYELLSSSSSIKIIEDSYNKYSYGLNITYNRWNKPNDKQAERFDTITENCINFFQNRSKFAINQVIDRINSYLE